jgi:general secretion pathway protein D
MKSRPSTSTKLGAAIAVLVLALPALAQAPATPPRAPQRAVPPPAGKPKKPAAATPGRPAPAPAAPAPAAPRAGAPPAAAPPAAIPDREPPGAAGDLPTTMDKIAQATDVPYKPKPPGAKVKFNLQDADLAELVNHISGITGKRFIYGAKVRTIKATVVSRKRTRRSCRSSTRTG